MTNPSFVFWKWRLLLICVTIAFLVPDVIFLFSKVKYVIKSLTYGTVIYLWLTDTISIQMYTHNILLWKLRPQDLLFTYICSLFTILFSVQKIPDFNLYVHILWHSTKVSNLLLLTREFLLSERMRFLAIILYKPL